ncbi:MAG: DUF2235 domain-containing protein [Hyphomicrobiaceae bacterium]
MSVASAPSRTQAHIITRKGSRILPIVALIVALALFIVIQLPSGGATLFKNLGQAVPPGEITAKQLQALLDSPVSQEKMWSMFHGKFPFGIDVFFGQIIQPLVKAYLDILFSDFGDIARSTFTIVLTCALYALLPGIAGLIYRRNFTTWFLIGFGALISLNASGIFGTLTSAQPMPGSGTFFFFIAAQVVILLLALRLRRHTQSVGFASPGVVNWTLAVGLWAIGIVLAIVWTPYQLASSDEIRLRREAALAGKASDGLRDCLDGCPALVEIPAAPGATPAVATTATAPAPAAPASPGAAPAPANPPGNAAVPPRQVPFQQAMSMVPKLYMMKYELTLGEWQACAAPPAKSCTWKLQKGEQVGLKDRMPVEVTLAQAQAYAAWLSRKTGQRYRLPTRVEWEHAVRAGTPYTSKWFYGNDVKQLNTYAWTIDGVHSVGLKKKPNPWGLEDVYGNVDEWVAGKRQGEAYEAAGHQLAGGSARRPSAMFEMTFATDSSMSAADGGVRLVREIGSSPPTIQPTSAGSASVDKDADYKPRSVWSILSSGMTGWVFKWEVLLLGLPLLYSLLRDSNSWTGRERKNIVICLDGTSNTPDQLEAGFAAHTNVYKLFKMLKSDNKGGLAEVDRYDASLVKRYGNKQIGLYYAGVGNKYDNDPILQTIGMATGLGASDIIERAYLDLVRIHQPGDRIFIVGFSRGAAISRLLARTIDARGAPRAVWTLKLFGKHRVIWASRRKHPVTIDVLGCFDTVGSFGVAKTIAGINLQQLNMFKDLTVPDNVRQAYHMVALDEQRQEFEPTLMDPDAIRPERIVEVWFAGDHANIGGGWATDKLSDVTLDFLLRQVSSGYAFDPSRQPGDESWGIFLTASKGSKAALVERQNRDDDIMVIDPDPLGQVRHWFSNIYNYRPRKLPLHAVISESVFDRMVGALPVYAPQALFDLNDALDEKRDTIAEKVVKLGETHSLSDEERQRMLDYNEKLRLTRYRSYIEMVTAGRKLPGPAQALTHGAAESKAVVAA